MDLEFSEAIFGVDRTIEVRTLVACDDCEGSGAAPGTTPVVCSACGGAGQVRQVRQSLLGCADMVEAVDFDLPIAPTLRHLQERWDGGGYPDGIDGEAIEIGARLIAVANAFVGMVSPRAWRDALGFDEAAAEFMAESGLRFDPRPVAALINVINNRGGRETWAHFSQAPEGEGEDA